MENDAPRPRCQPSVALTVAVAATDDDGDFKLAVVKDRQMQNSTWRCGRVRRRHGLRGVAVVVLQSDLVFIECGIIRPLVTLLVG